MGAVLGRPEPVPVTYAIEWKSDIGNWKPYHQSSDLTDVNTEYDKALAYYNPRPFRVVMMRDIPWSIPMSDVQKKVIRENVSFNVN